MKTITIKNLSTLANYSAVTRVARLMAGDEYYATHGESGKAVVQIKQRGDTYTVFDEVTKK